MDPIQCSADVKRGSSGSDPSVHMGPECIRPKLVRLFYPTQTGTDNRPKHDRIEEASLVYTRPIRSSLGSDPNGSTPACTVLARKTTVT